MCMKIILRYNLRTTQTLQVNLYFANFLAEEAKRHLLYFLQWIEGWIYLLLGVAHGGNKGVSGSGQ